MPSSPTRPKYGALFLGHHDALAAGAERVAAAALEAHEAFGFSSRAVRPSLFLFIYLIQRL